MHVFLVQYGAVSKVWDVLVWTLSVTMMKVETGRENKNIYYCSLLGILAEKHIGVLTKLLNGSLTENYKQEEDFVGIVVDCNRRRPILTLSSRNCVFQGVHSTHLRQRAASEAARRSNGR
jgi:hypothetical protein